MVIEFDISSGILYAPICPTNETVMPEMVSPTTDWVGPQLAVVDLTPSYPEVDCEQV